MALFPLVSCLSHEAKVKLLELYGSLGGDVKALECKITDLEEQWGRKPTEIGEDVAKIMKKAPHYRGKPG